MANRRYNQFINTPHNKLVILDCNFVVDPSNLNGKGISSLKGPGIANVFMNTTASFVGDTHTNFIIDNISSTANLVVGMPISGTGIPAGAKVAGITSATAITTTLATTATNAAVTISYRAVGSPNPAAGLIFVNLQDNFNKAYVTNVGLLSPLSGTSITVSTGSSLTVGAAYTITALGTTTTAQWVVVGVPVGITPAVGVTFIAAATSGTGTGTVQSSLTTGISNVEVIGDPNTTITSLAATVLGISSGAYMILKAVSAGTITLSGATHTNTVIDGITPSTAGLRVGQSISGTGIPLGTTIATITSASAITISQAATASATVALTTGGQISVAPTAGSTLALSFFMSNTMILNGGE